MVSIVDVACPVCSSATVVLAPDGMEVLGATKDLTDSLSEQADVTVRSTCDDGHEFVVYLHES